MPIKRKPRKSVTDVTPVSPLEILSPTSQTKKSISEALRSRIDSGAGEDIASEIISIATTAELDRDKIAAANFIADRVEGKPLQKSIRINTMDESTAKQLLQIGQAMQAYLAKKVLDQGK